MLFSSIIFIFYFLPLTLLAYYVVPAEKLNIRNMILLIASLIFYSWGEPVYVFLMIYSAIFNYYMAMQITSEQQRGGTGKKNLIFTIVINLFILGFFKYFGFLMDTVNSVFNTDIHYTALALPIGISFYTFQGLSYIFDVYRRKVKPQKSLLKFALYLSLFPQLIAGPIVKYRDVEKQLDNRKFCIKNFGNGTERFILGLGKKVLLANSFGSVHAYVLGLPDSKVSVLVYWLGIFAYTLQIYFDFSGYSDMAIGLGKMFGFDFIENFNYPYISKTITEFWRRWHMSLSTWFKEYVYIPLGGNRVTVPRHILNLLIVWSLTGLWHGANWNFVMWGLYYGVILILEKYIFGEYIEKLPDVFKHIYVMLVVMTGWVFFSITNISKAFSFIGIMLGAGKYPFADSTAFYVLRTNIVLFIIGTVCSTPYIIKWFRELCEKHKKTGIVILFTVMLISCAYLVYGSYNPFLYFRF